MATISPQWGPRFEEAQEVLWETCATGDTIEHIAAPMPGFSVQMTGTWGSATAVMQGSNDGSNWVALKDAQGNDVSLTADGGFDAVVTGWEYVRPSLSGGSSDDIDVTVRFRP